MTNMTNCLGCEGNVFLYDPQDYKYVYLHPKGGIVSADADVSSDEDIHKRGYDTSWWRDNPGQVTCAVCGLEAEKVRLDPLYNDKRRRPNYRWPNEPEFKIKIHGNLE